MIAENQVLARCPIFWGPTRPQKGRDAARVIKALHFKYFIQMQHAKMLPGQSLLQEFFVLTDSIHQQVKILLDSIGLFKQSPWHWRREQREGCIIHHLQAGMQQNSQVWAAEEELRTCCFCLSKGTPSPAGQTHGLDPGDS